MKLKKVLKSAVVAGIASLMMISNVYASNDLNIMDPITSEETMADFSEDTSYSLLRGNNLSLGNVKISKLSSNEINIYGLTQCHHECDELWLNLYLEQKVDGSYATYKYWKLKDYNNTSLSTSMNVIVPSGHYYRVRGYHAAKDGTKESTSTLTSGIWVG